MASADTLTAVKQALRISHSKLDADIGANIDACIKDLETCGIKKPNATDPLILQAIKIYCRAQFTDDTAAAERFQKGYDSLKGSLMTAAGYGNGGAPDV